MSDRSRPRRLGETGFWSELAQPDVEQSRRFLAESLSLLLADLLRSVLADASPAMPADEATVDRFRQLAGATTVTTVNRPTGLGVTRAALAKRCVDWLKSLLLDAPAAHASPAMREFIDALALFPALFDGEPSARSRRARLTWLLTHDRRLDASTREAATALIAACEHLGTLLWPDAETA